MESIANGRTYPGKASANSVSLKGLSPCLTSARLPLHLLYALNVMVSVTLGYFFKLHTVLVKTEKL